MTGPDSRAAVDHGTTIDPDGAERSRRLTELVQAEINAAADRRINFARFMELALYEPELGYYRQAAHRPTRGGDFLTAPETHPVFGWTLARRIEEMWVALDRPDGFRLIEYGAGSGTLALSIFEGLMRHGAGLADALVYVPVELNEYRSTELARRFEEAGLSDRLAPSADPGLPPESGRVLPVTGVVLANEFLDALPVHRVLARKGALRELFVAWRDGPVLVIGEPSTPHLAERLAADAVVLAEGQAAEICLGLAPWLDEVAARLARGFVLAIDYGFPAAELYGPRHFAGTLLGYRSHRVVDDPMSGIGLTDITAHVDFTALERLAAERGLELASLEKQSRFLVGSGLEAELQAIQSDPTSTMGTYLRARSSIVRLLDPRHMGGFSVLTLSRGWAGAEGKGAVRRA